MLSPIESPEYPVGIDRRKWKRFDIDQEAFCQFKNPGNEEVFMFGRLTNVSRGGMKFLASQRMEPGTHFRIGIADDVEERFTLLLSQVVYVCEAPECKWFVGCEFTPIIREDIFAWIEKIGEKLNGISKSERVLVAS